MNRIDDSVMLRDLRCEETRDLAFRLLYDTYFTPVKLLAVRLVNDFTMAQDLAQDVFSEFWNERPYVKEEIRSFASFLFNRCRMRCWKHNEHKNRRMAHQRNIEQTIAPVVDPHIGGDAQRHIAQLPRQQRMVMLLVVLWECSYAEAAAIMGTSVRTVRTHIERAKKSLANIYIDPL
ncbi:sigma-70 family RNA polymerase sigma factor [Chitinophaga sp. YIM B06452]|uniref:RNA polymerase sigma factor n=1 Tax=Chitinophaga sp. YIM B06452 TaxID=3082158 RepID=UPI0031FE836F